jgi:hypothetical protein
MEIILLRVKLDSAPLRIFEENNGVITGVITHYNAFKYA